MHCLDTKILLIDHCCIADSLRQQRTKLRSVNLVLRRLLEESRVLSLASTWIPTLVGRALASSRVEDVLLFQSWSCLLKLEVLLNRSYR